MNSIKCLRLILLSVTWCESEIPMLKSVGQYYFHITILIWFILNVYDGKFKQKYKQKQKWILFHSCVFLMHSTLKKLLAIFSAKQLYTAQNLMLCKDSRLWFYPGNLHFYVMLFCMTTISYLYWFSCPVKDTVCTVRWGPYVLLHIVSLSLHIDNQHVDTVWRLDIQRTS